ncbi:MAG TPA: UDP-glucose/GDP-mannose dehydrogenase family protein [Verrucomicrobiae bacterium]|jgi:UDPglucose 6-dehydrogenase|nr:UDP-glucose/GDP-mannose dehydrogenase family protein [Verrucomicrobiae bacterium]
MRISVIGSGYVGLVTAVCFAELGHEVTLYDNDPAKQHALQQGLSPIHERYVPELLKRHLGGKLNLSNSLADSVGQSVAIFVAVGTPPTVNGEADLSYVESVAREIAANIKDYKIVVGKSTVPVYTSEWVRRVMLLNGAPADLFDVASNPEFLREGTAVTDFLYPDRIVIGTDNLRCTETLQQIYRPLTDGSYYQRGDAIPAPKPMTGAVRLIATTAKSAELIKYASNAFLAMKISFINAVATLCESVGADVDQVKEGIGSDSRIGRQFLNPGLGYGGSCFPKDLSAYRAVARECGYDFRLLEEVMHINNEQRERFLRKVRHALWTLKGKRLGVLGLAFKGGTDDVRESPAVAVVKSLIDEGCRIQAYDPAAVTNAREILGSQNIEYVASALDAAKDADALLVLTDWEEFRTLDLVELHKRLHYPIVIDGRNMFNPDAMAERGFIYTSVGRPDVPHEIPGATNGSPRQKPNFRTPASPTVKVP